LTSHYLDEISILASHYAFQYPSLVTCWNAAKWI